MINQDEVFEKLKSAARILNRSIGEKGIFAGSGERYKHQYWTRDVALAMFSGFRSLELLKYAGNRHVRYSEINNHINNLKKLQSSNGAIPILFSDFEELREKKMRKCKWNGTQLDIGNSFILKRIFDGMYCDAEQCPEFYDFPKRDERGLYRLTPGTTDSELLYAYATLGNTWTDESTLKAVQYLEEHYVCNGLHHGADWRDTMEKFFIDKPLLTNNTLLYAVYEAQGEMIKAWKLKEAIDKTFWTGETYLDYPGSTRFDPLGASLAVIHGLVPPERFESIIKGFHSVDSSYGVTARCKHNAYQDGEQEVIERTDGVVVFPFITGFTVIAASIIDKNFAFEQFEKLHKLDGFAEWYDPSNGKKWGEHKQGWSAALYIMAAHKLYPELFY